MVQDVFVGLPLAMFDTIVIFGIWGDVVTGPELGEVALDVAGRAGASRSGESKGGDDLYACALGGSSQTGLG